MTVNNYSGSIKCNIEQKLSNYMTTAYSKYSKMKTLLYRDEEKEVEGFYECNDIYDRTRARGTGSKSSSDDLIVHNYDAAKLVSEGKHIVITGTGGLGKSMMLRHLLLSAIKDYDILKRVPFLVPLRDYDSKDSRLEKHIYNQIKILAPDLTEEEFEGVARAGNCIFLLDGMDEIATLHRGFFEFNLEIFGGRQNNNICAVASRPYSNFVMFSKFKVMALQPFSKSQAKGLIEKLDYRPDSPEIKAKFLAQLDERLFYEHEDFASNPLLLTIMLITFEQIADIPNKMHIFYQEAYLALSKHHDASKGAYRREMHTKLSSDRFREILEEFFARTYVDELFRLEYKHIKRYLEETVAHSRYPEEKDISVDDFIYDVTVNLCLLQYEDACYNFTHRSFQEYFCACFFARQKDAFIKKLGDFFEKRASRSGADKTFDMLYEMEPAKVEEFIIIPFISNFLAECRNGEGYFTFLEKAYPTFDYVDGDKIGDAVLDIVTGGSFLYSFIRREYDIGYDIHIVKLEPYEEFEKDMTWFMHIPNGNESNAESPIAEVDEIDGEEISNLRRRLGYDGIYTCNINAILDNKEKYAKIISQLSEKDFPLYREYVSLCELLPELKEKYRIKGENLFDFI